MTINYEKTENTLIRYNEDGSITSIPFDEGNSDYQAWLNPEAEQSTPILPGGNSQ
jgi:hypothetical protein